MFTKNFEKKLIEEAGRKELLRRRRIGDAHRGVPKSSEHKRAMSEAQRQSWARRKAARTEQAQA